MGYIYKIVNLVNGKIYVGQTRFDLQRRFHQHLYEAKKGELQYPLYSAIRKYGEQNFQIECIEEIDDELLGEREQYWIRTLDTFVKNNKGYNATYGGEGNPVIDKNEIYDLWDTGISIQEITEKTGHDRSSIRKILQQYKNYSVEESHRRGDIAQKRYLPKIKQYDMQGNYLQTYANMAEAERQTGISHKNIWNVVHHSQKSAGSYQWRYENDETPVQDLTKRTAIKRKVKQIDNNTQQIIKIYDTTSAASRETGIGYSRIQRCCTQHKIMLPENYKWEYIE